MNTRKINIFVCPLGGHANILFKKKILNKREKIEENHNGGQLKQSKSHFILKTLWHKPIFFLTIIFLNLAESYMIKNLIFIFFLSITAFILLYIGFDHTPAANRSHRTRQQFY